MTPKGGLNPEGRILQLKGIAIFKVDWRIVQENSKRGFHHRAGFLHSGEHHHLRLSGGEIIFIEVWAVFLALTKCHLFFDFPVDASHRLQAVHDARHLPHVPGQQVVDGHGHDYECGEKSHAHGYDHECGEKL